MSTRFVVVLHGLILQSCPLVDGDDDNVEAGVGAILLVPAENIVAIDLSAFLTFLRYWFCFLWWLSMKFEIELSSRPPICR